jgi:hypothetical protein
VKGKVKLSKTAEGYKYKHKASLEITRVVDKRFSDVRRDKGISKVATTKTSFNTGVTLDNCEVPRSASSEEIPSTPPFKMGTEPQLIAVAIVGIAV